MAAPAELTRVPTSVPGSKVRAFLSDLGIEINDVLVGDRAGVLFSSKITATLMARDENGNGYVDQLTKDIATHQVSIAIDWTA